MCHVWQKDENPPGPGYPPAGFRYWGGETRCNVMKLEVFDRGQLRSVLNASSPIESACTDARLTFAEGMSCQLSRRWMVELRCLIDAALVLLDDNEKHSSPYR
jgi:hypothetical protein